MFASLIHSLTDAHFNGVDVALFAVVGGLAWTVRAAHRLWVEAQQAVQRTHERVRYSLRNSTQWAINALGEGADLIFVEPDPWRRGG